MKLNTTDIRNSKHIGETVWICHYHRPDMNKKALRNVSPTKVIIVDNDELPDNKWVYYSETHFRPISKAGKVLATIISPVDNTGFRHRSGNELYVFDNEAECIAEWQKQLQNHIVVLDELIRTAADHWKQQKEILLKLGEK